MASPTAGPQPDAADTRTVRVLVVSADATERLRASAGLAARPDVEVIEGTSAADGHRLADAEQPDVLVVDGDMRPEGGQSLVYELRANAQQRGGWAPPAIVLVAREQDRWLSNWAGAAEVMVKPVDPFAVADRVLELARARRTEGGGGGDGDDRELVGEPLAMDGAPPELDRPDAPPAR